MKHFWFRRKRYGYGWYPASWQGWVVLLVFFILLIGSATVLSRSFKGNDFLLSYLCSVSVLSISLIIVAIKTGEKPKWQWGGK